MYIPEIFNKKFLCWVYICCYAYIRTCILITVFHLVDKRILSTSTTF